MSTSTEPSNMNDPEIIFSDAITTLQNQLRYYQDYLISVNSKSGKTKKQLRLDGKLFMQEVHFLAVTSLTAMQEARQLNIQLQLENEELAANNAALEAERDAAGEVALELEEELRKEQSKTFSQKVEDRIAALAQHPVTVPIVIDPVGPIEIPRHGTIARFARLAFGAEKTAEQREEEMAVYWAKYRTQHPRSTHSLAIEKGDKANQRLAEAMNQCRPGQPVHLVCIDRYQNGKAIGLHLVRQGSLDFSSRTIGLWSAQEAEEATEFFGHFLSTGTEHTVFSWKPESVREYIRAQVVPLEWKSQDDIFMNEFVTVYSGSTPDHAVWPVGEYAPKN